MQFVINWKIYAFCPYKEIYMTYFPLSGKIRLPSKTNYAASHKLCCCNVEKQLIESYIYNTGDPAEGNIVFVFHIGSLEMPDMKMHTNTIVRYLNHFHAGK